MDKQSIAQYIKAYLLKVLKVYSAQQLKILRLIKTIKFIFKHLIQRYGEGTNHI